jgi:hypothetical protein
MKTAEEIIFYIKSKYIMSDSASNEQWFNCFMNHGLTREESFQGLNILRGYKIQTSYLISE